MNDFRFAWRQLLKNPGSSALAVLILALGIGGATAVFSVADKVLLNPIPGQDPDRLISMHELDALHGRRWCMSPPLIEELTTHSNLIDGLTCFFQSSEERKLRVGEKKIRLRGAQVAPNFFALLGLRPVLGRTFLPGEGASGSENIIMLRIGNDLVPPVELTDFYSIETQLRRSTEPQRVMMWLLISLGALGLFLSTLGVYAVMAYAVSRRRREIGIRMAVGAERRDIAGQFFRQGARLLANGMLVGIVGAFAATQSIKGLLFKTSSSDPIAYVGGLVILGMAGAIACWLPARRAAKTEPMEVLRHE